MDNRPNLRETKGCHTTGKNVIVRNINMELDEIKDHIDKYYKEIMECDYFVTAEKVKNTFLVVLELL